MNETDRQRVWQYAYDATRVTFSDTVSRQFADDYVALQEMEIAAAEEIREMLGREGRLP